MKEQKEQMAFPRTMAVVIVFLLIGSMALLGIDLVSWFGPTLAHGSNIAHQGGKILSITNGRDFLFRTDSGQNLSFQCRENCRASLGHMQRHINEKAHTDVYYIQETATTLLAVDVD